jgi:single-stranded DNA-binding protein
MITLTSLVRIIAIKKVEELPTGTKLLNFTIANNRYCGGETATDSFNVVAFGKTAEFISNSNFAHQKNLWIMKNQ